MSKIILPTEKRFIGTVDMTPTWSSVVDLIANALAGPDEKKRAVAMSEFKRMARAADEYNTLIRESKRGPRS